MDLIEKVRVQAFHRARFGNESLTELGFRNLDSQRKRFEAICQWGDMSNCTVMDLGCGYGDLKPFLDSQFSNITYLGIDFLKEFIAGADARYGHLPNTQFIQADFLTAGLPEVDIIVASGSLNYHSENQLHLWQTISRMWQCARKGIAFNLLDAENFQSETILCGYDKNEVEVFCRSLTPQVKILADYLRDDFTIFMYSDSAADL